MDDHGYWDKGDEEYDSDNDVAISPVVEDAEVFLEDDSVEEVSGKLLKNKVSPPIMWEYEKTNIITKRKDELDKGKPSKMEDEVLKNNITSSYDIAILEFENGKIDYLLKRKHDRGYYELWKHNDFLYFPK